MELKQRWEDELVAGWCQSLTKWVLSHCQSHQDVLLVGIARGGFELAKHISIQLPIPLAVHSIDITLYRDDLYQGGERPILGGTMLPLDIDGCNILLIDDVLFTGRTVRAALHEIYDYGRPASVQLAVLVDRGHRELPIQADCVGVEIATAKSDKVQIGFAQSGLSAELWTRQGDG